jgi:hypothetical protein
MTASKERRNPKKKSKKFGSKQIEAGVGNAAYAWQTRNTRT